MTSHCAKTHSARGAARLYTVNNDLQGLGDVLCVARFQQMLEEAQLVPEVLTGDHKPMHPAPAFVIDGGPRDARA